MSVSKPFVFALVCETIGPEEARARLGANATGLPFNSLAAAGALMVELLTAIVLGQIAANPVPKEVQSQVDLDNINFVSNDRLRSVMEGTTATPQQVEEAVRVNTEARLRALKIGLLSWPGLPCWRTFRRAGCRITCREKFRAMRRAAG